MQWVDNGLGNCFKCVVAVVESLWLAKLTERDYALLALPPLARNWVQAAAAALESLVDHQPSGSARGKGPVSFASNEARLA